MKTKQKALEELNKIEMLILEYKNLDHSNSYHARHFLFDLISLRGAYNMFLEDLDFKSEHYVHVLNLLKS